ncbi:sigma-B regulation protein RsbU (phosphoserine phosphatase) [Rhodovulum euryhalinum]|uniref:Sigma-B regulation protein RsbU (Phosphoserine phosphatase) n=1 Tax=Rhodovulum euryhalinum TaxID=35805 RepID=A0A4V2SAY7_9RHOB|nr:SpoIIE family protein phosphatase [Rhodovulum euryhalinum]TCO73450.1 sigma-B regulation protein RsbU (phosphoserine phosphatase) [Rhodovulum euryhalinum]
MNVETEHPEFRQDPPSLVRLVLLVDDSRLQRRILRASLERWGYAVAECGSAEEALDICRERPVDLIISDWMMPGMNGPEFCSAFRALPRDSYGYFILLTSKSETGEMVHGLDVGADEFLTKPVNANELRARIASGERILRMEHQLREQNRLLSATLAELRTLYDAIDRDLVEARKLQQSLVREHSRRFGASEVTLLLRPCGHVGGDLVGFFPAGDGKVGLFSVDVSGHGISSAMVTARLAGLLVSSSPDQNLALEGGEDGTIHARPPEEVVEHLNRLFLEELETEHYFTILLALVSLDTGEMRFVQAGHPYPAIQRADGTIEFLGAGGLPVGLIPGAGFEAGVAHLAPGDRVFLASDGITECPSPTDEQLGEEGLCRLLKTNAHVRGEAFFAAIMEDLVAYAGTADMPDDISAVLFEFG